MKNTEIVVPDCCNEEWQRDMLRELAQQLEDLGDFVELDDGHDIYMRSVKIVDALQEYTGY